jgi:hypothetical protein
VDWGREEILWETGLCELHSLGGKRAGRED